MLSNIVAPVFLLGFLIFIHEFGHFFFAKIFGIRVEQFSFGFGPRLAGFKIGETDYRLNLIPLGGYVKMVGDDPFDDPENLESDGFLNQAVWKRLFVVGAGPAFNLILPIFVLGGVYMTGSPESIAWVGSLEAGSDAEKAGLELGDRIVAVNGEAVGFWIELNDQMLMVEEGDSYSLTVDRDGQQHSLTVDSLAYTSFAGQRFPELGFSRHSTRAHVSVVAGSTAEKAGLQSGDRIVSVDGKAIEWWHELEGALLSQSAVSIEVVRGDDPLKETTGTEALKVSLSPEALAFTWAGDEEPSKYVGKAGSLEAFDSQWFYQQHSTAAYGLLPLELELGDVPETMPAFAAGVRPGDFIAGLGGVSVANWSQVVRDVGNQVESAVLLTVLRGNELHGFTIVPQVQETVTPAGETVKSAKVGIGPRAGRDAPTEPMRLGVVDALAKGASETGYIIAMTVKIIGKVIVGDIAAKDSIGGPIAMVQYAQQAANVSIFRYFKMMSLISVSLGLMNLLPIPLLDGGHILFFSVEAIRGQPVSLRFREVSHQIGLVFLLTLIAFAIINDTRIHILN